jgi:Ca2+-binding EF-hand superfamily protein
MVRWLSAAVLSSLGLVAPNWILAQENSETKPPLPDVNELFQQLDANSDGQVADDEVSDEHSRLFKRLLRNADKDGDGKLSRAEFLAGLQEERPQPPADGRPGPQRNEGLRRFAQADPEQVFQRLDANGDGKLELDEMPEQAREGLRRFFEQADANRDQSLSLEELRKGQEYLRRLTGAGAPPNAQTANPANRGAGPADGALFGALDANGDGAISSEELAAAADALKKLDRDGDGQLTRRELMGAAGERPATRPAPPNAEQARERFNRFDKNGDGKLAQDELPPFLQNRFDKLDANADGFVDQEELVRAQGAFRGQFQNQRRPGRPSRPSDETRPSESKS